MEENQQNQTSTLSEKELHKLEVKRNREEFKKNPYEYAIKPFISFWKENPLKAVGTFMFWALLFYAGFSGLQALNYDMMYCDSSLDQYDGKILFVYNEFVDEMNRQTEEFNQMQYSLDKTGIKNNKPPNSTIECRYDTKRWWSGEKDFFKNLKILMVDRWHKSTN